MPRSVESALRGTMNRPLRIGPVVCITAALCLWAAGAARGAESKPFVITDTLGGRLPKIVPAGI
jgi:hypothetical protein